MPGVGGSFAKGMEPLGKRLTSPGFNLRDVSDEELLEIALAPEAGILKPLGMAKFMGPILRDVAEFRRAGSTYKDPFLKSSLEGAASELSSWLGKAVRELGRIPQKEYSRVKNVAGEYVLESRRGRYTHGTPYKGIMPGKPGYQGEVFFSVKDALPSTFWHEFAHARQYSPEKSERAKSAILLKLGEMMDKLAPKVNTADELARQRTNLYVARPIEKMARDFATVTTKRAPSGQEEYDRLYSAILDRTLSFYKKHGPKVVKQKFAEEFPMLANYWEMNF